MSDVRAVKYADPRLKNTSQRFFAIPLGPEQNTYQKITASSNLSTDSVSFNYNSNPAYAKSKRWFYKVYLEIIMTGTGNPLTQYGVSDSLKWMPLTSSQTSANLRLNDQSFSVTPRNYIDALSRYISMDELKDDLSSSASMVDTHYDYTEMSGPRNVMGSFQDASIDSPDLRGSVVLQSLSVEGNGTSTFRFEIIEPLFIPPLLYARNDEPAMLGIQNIGLNINHSWTLANVWSHANANVLSSATFNFYNPPELLINELSPNANIAPYDPRATRLG